MTTLFPNSVDFLSQPSIMQPMNVINTIAPIFLMIALGMLLRAKRFLSADLVKGLNRLVYWIGLPTLLFYKIATSTYDLQTAGRTYLVVILGMLACLIVAIVAALVTRVPFSSFGTFCQGAFRGNLAFIGLVVIVYSFASAPADQSSNAQAIGAIVLAMTVPVYNVLSVTMLLLSRHSLGKGFIKRIVKNVLTNPLVIACVAGIAYSIFLPPLPVAIDRTCAAIGHMALPLALMGIGATLVTEKVQGHLTPAILSSLIKTAIAPIAGFFLAKMLNLSPDETRIALIFLACPTAIASYTLTTEIGGNPKLAAAIVVISTIFATISLSAVLAMY